MTTSIGTIIARPDTSTMLERSWHHTTRTTDDNTAVTVSVESWQHCSHVAPHQVLVGVGIVGGGAFREIAADISLDAARALLEVLPAAIAAAEQATAYQP